MSRQNSRLHRRKKSSKKGLPSIKSGVTKFILFASVIIFILSLTQEQWMASISKKENTSEIKNEQTTNENQDSLNNENNTDAENSEDHEDKESVNNNDADAETGNDEESSTSDEEDATDSTTEEAEDEQSSTVDQGGQDNENDNNVKIVIHTVIDNETLYKISMKYYGSRKGEQLIKEYNKLEDNNIYVGQELKIPLEN
ncbi:hypothetical protein CIB95_07185 [Lottiidibacillus patelloidae]|uniref:LysM domain-containing protein n=1 Tax=Lottiidibacillus patelloidae TaxID=2670334 RepID=A0A263BU48_9BACI|nr:LysM peptidoglycan-binding domain-containing protein [Lottiidibacillus patelloidae]OZM57240.1 hypothetical protein CIB95_07185 [Lottiidibacillus patelloidae]